MSMSGEKVHFFFQNKVKSRRCTFYLLLLPFPRKSIDKVVTYAYRTKKRAFSILLFLRWQSIIPDKWLGKGRVECVNGWHFQFQFHPAPIFATKKTCQTSFLKQSKKVWMKSAPHAVFKTFPFPRNRAAKSKHPAITREIYATHFLFWIRRLLFMNAYRVYIIHNV